MLAEGCTFSYSKISMLTKLKYVEIYCLFVRSRAEYCSLVFPRSLTQEQSEKNENIQKTSLRIILHDEYDNYKSAPTRTDVSFANGKNIKQCNYIWPETAE